jgi:hypothetical protein
MGYVKEPKGVNFFVNSTPLNEEDRKEISEIIAYYKITGKKKLLKKSNSNGKIKSKKSVS